MAGSRKAATKKVAPVAATSTPDKATIQKNIQKALAKRRSPK